VNPLWEARLRRATTLGLAWPFATKAMRFHRAVTSFQRDIYHQLGPEAHFDPARLASFLPGFLAMIDAAAPEDVGLVAQKLRDKQDPEWELLFRMAWRGPLDSPFQFFLNSMLHPCALRLAEAWRAEVGVLDGSTAQCPFCGRAPQVIAVRDGRRLLVCSMCSTEWPAEAGCARCREARRERLSHDAVPEIPWMWLETCDSCGLRIKTVDLTAAPDAVPLVDDVAALPLTALARRGIGPT
jgi:formate dehydrogenase maturation protein FdhE